MKSLVILTITILLSSAINGVVSSSGKVCLLRNAGNSNCLSKGVHINDDELALIAEFCETDNSQNVKILTTKGSEISEQEFHAANCPNLIGSYVWLHWNDFLTHFKISEYKFSEGNVYLGRNVLHNVTRNMDLCKIEFENGHCSSLSDENSQHVVSTEILVQRLPVVYELKDVTVSPWKNITEGEETILAMANLSNHHQYTQFVQKIIPYDLVRTTRIVLPDFLDEKIYVNVYDGPKLSLKFFPGDFGTTLITKSASVIKRLLARTTVEASVKGVNSKTLSEINANLITVFDKADDQTIVQRFTRNITTSRIEEGVINVFTEFGIFIKIDPNAEPEEEEYYPPLDMDVTTGWPSSEGTTSDEFTPERATQLFRNPGPVYPGFRTYSTIAAVIFFSTLGITLFDVARKALGTRKAKRAYQAVQNKHY